MILDGLIFLGLLLLLAFLPLGLATAIVGRHNRRYRTTGLILVLLSLPAYLILSPLIIWKIDDIRGWEVKLSTTIPGYAIEFIHRPGFDFYDTFFEITRSDGKRAIIIIDADDSKWWSHHIIEQDGRTYFSRNKNITPDRTSFVEPENDLIYSGYYKRFYKLSELEFN